MFRIEQALNQVTESLFDTIVANELDAATTLATQMLYDERAVADVVRTALERARADFDSYDGSDSPRSWVLGYVAAEAMKR